MKKILLFAASCISILTAAQIPANYYNGTTGLTGAALKTKLSQIITAGHQDKGYNGLWTAYATTDRDYFFENDGTILDIYSEKPNAADSYNYTLSVDQCGFYLKESDCYNREHIVPQSLFSENYPMRSDVHFIRATDGYVNGVRSNYPFGKVGTATFTSTNGSKLGSSVSPGYSGIVFEPIDEFKGDVARMVFYFVTRYENQLSGFSTGNILGGSAYPGLQPWERDVLLQWNAQDPVSQVEIARNNASYVFQGNRNPYIDNPQWVTAVWNPAALGTQEIIGSATEISIYPNPVRDGKIFIKGKLDTKETSAEIYDEAGRLMDRQTVNLINNSIDIHQLTTGVYFLKLAGGTHKVIVE